MDRDGNLLIVGAGQYGCVAKEIAQEMKIFRKIAFLDDQNPVAIGKLDNYLDVKECFSAAIVALGNPNLRLSWIHRLEAAGYCIPVLIHPRAYVSPSAQLGKGTIVEPMAVIQANAVVGVGGLICAGSVVNHNAVVESGCQIDCGAIIPSNAVLPANTKVACGTVYRN